MQDSYQYSIFDYDNGGQPNHKALFQEHLDQVFKRQIRDSQDRNLQEENRQLREEIEQMTKEARKQNKLYLKICRKYDELQRKVRELTKQAEIDSFMEQPSGSLEGIRAITKRIDALEEYQGKIAIELEQLLLKRLQEMTKGECSLFYRFTMKDPSHIGYQMPGNATMYLKRGDQEQRLFDFLPFADSLGDYCLRKVPNEYKHDAECLFLKAKAEYEQMEAEYSRKCDEEFFRSFSSFSGFGADITDIPEEHRKKIVRTLAKKFHPDADINNDDCMMQSVVELKRILKV